MSFFEDEEIKFTTQENNFLNTHLQSLDPKRTNVIAVKRMLSFLKYTLVGDEHINTIIQNCKIENKQLLTYEDAKKIFRGISLIQKGIHPSIVNINANIQLKMPELFDSESEDEKKPVPPPINTPPQSTPATPKANNQPQVTVRQPTQTNVNPSGVSQSGGSQSGGNKSGRNPSGVSQSLSVNQFLPGNQVPSQSIQVAVPYKKSISDSEHVPTRGSNIVRMNSEQINRYNDYWNSLHLVDDRIDGKEVRRLCRNHNQKGNLSCAWEICNIHHQKSLSKGEYYAFLEMSKLEKVPSQLPPEMKTIIEQIDKATTSKPTTKSSVTSSTPPISNKNNTSFAAFQTIFSASPNAPVASSSNITLPLSSKMKQSVPAIPVHQVNNLNGSTDSLITFLPKQLPPQIQSKKKEVTQSTSALAEQAISIKKQQENIYGLFSQIETFLQDINAKNATTSVQIEQIRAAQTAIHQRMNGACYAMMAVITRQSQQINALTNELSHQAAVNSQRVDGLEKYISQMKVQNERSENAVESNRQKNELASSQGKIGAEQKEEPAQPLDQSMQITAENEQRINLKRRRIIEMLHYLSPLKEPEYRLAWQRVSSYTEQQLDQSYANLYERYLQKQKAEEARKKQQQENDFLNAKSEN